MNWIGFKTLYFKEVRRFIKVYHQTLLAPMVTAMLFLAVFSLAVGRRVEMVGEVPFQVFMVSGLIMMTVIQNAFANTSSSFTMGKVLGSIIDYLLPPLSAGEITAAMTLGGITRGIAAGLMVALVACFFVKLSIESPLLALLYLILGAAFMSLLGLLAGIFSESFDQMTAITSYIVTPLAFLSGTFYSVKYLPVFWQQVNLFNPFFYIIDGFRYSVTGHADSNIAVGITILIFANVTLYSISQYCIAKGIRLKT